MFSHKNNRLLNAIYRQEVDATPVWLMRQAGRYLPEYRAVRRAAKSFMNLCKTPELACEVTLQPLARFNLDAAIIFSDILTIPDAMGLELEVLEGKGPYFQKPLKTINDIHRLPDLALEKLDYVYQAIRLVTKNLANKLPLIGFCGSPFTVAAYMLEGESKPGFPKMMAFLEAEPASLHLLLKRLSVAMSLHLNAQIEAGVSAVMIFDTWGGLLDTKKYREFSLGYIKQIIHNLIEIYNNSKVPVILFTRQGNQWLEEMASSGCDVIGLDWEISLREAKKRVGDKVSLQGNLNPAQLLLKPDEIRKAVQHILAEYGQGSGHIFNLGHGITPDIPPEHVAALIDAVHEFSPIYHQRA